VRSGRERARWQGRIDELAARHERGELRDEEWFAAMAEVYEGAYLPGGSFRSSS
jgi:hypothetical protein